MSAADVLRMLANGETKVSDCLRAASLLPEVREDAAMSEWIHHELVGYHDVGKDEVPMYRQHHLAVHGNATNGAWLHQNVVVPTRAFSEPIKRLGAQTTVLRHNIGGIEAALAGEGELTIPWPHEPVLLLNAEIARGGTAIDQTYAFTEVWFALPRNIVHQLLETVRQRALSQLAERVPREQLALRAEASLPAVPTRVAVQGTGNQVIVGSPGAHASIQILENDRDGLDAALASMGVSGNHIAELHEILDGDDEPGRVMRALEWSRGAAKDIGVNTVGSAAATLILQYLGLV
jgi:hypothetical protein